MPKIEQHNLRQMINNHFFDRDQTKEILENFVTVDNNSVLHVGLPEPANVALTTPNNAITTADVGTLKAKVTDANSNNCYGVPVDFVNRKTREVIGQGITDLNGEAYYNFRLEDSDIFSVQAKLSQDYLFHDGAILNNTATWGNSGNIVQEIYHDYTLIYKDDDSLDSLLYSPTLSGYTEISFKAKLVDAAASDSFCGLIETNSSGTVTGTLNGITLSQLGLTASSNGQWYKFYINVLGTDVLIKAINLETGAVSTASVTLSAAMSYFSFCFVLTGDLTTTYFSDVKINKCSDDLTMFVKDKNNLFGFNPWTCGDYSNTLGFNSNGGTGYISAVKSNEWSSLGEYSAKVTMKNNASGYVRFGLTELSELLGKTIRFSCDIKTEYPLKVSIYPRINEEYSTFSVNVPFNSEGSFEVSYLVEDNVSKLLFGIDHLADNSSSDNITFYTDTWSLTVL